MTTFTTISNALVAVGAKPFATTVQALRDNPIAIGEADSSVALALLGGRKILLETIQPPVDTTAVTFLTNISGYRDIEVEFFLTKTGANTNPAAVEIRTTAGSWRTMGNAGSGSSSRSIAGAFLIQNIDNGDGTNLRISRGTWSESAIGLLDRSNLNTSWNSVIATDGFRYSSFTETINEVRVTCTTIEGDTADARGVFKLYGWPRTSRDA
jgi:hypothetical protein